MDVDDLIERRRLDPEYMKLLGLSMYAFSRMEKQVVTCSNVIDPGSALAVYANRHHNAENKRHELIVNARKLSDQDQIKTLENLAAKYFDLATQKRNKLFHSRPVSIDGKVLQYTSRTTDQNGSIREHVEFSAEEVENFIEECLSCASDLLDAIHGFLNEIYQWKKVN